MNDFTLFDYKERRKVRDKLVMDLLRARNSPFLPDSVRSEVVALLAKLGVGTEEEVA